MTEEITWLDSPGHIREEDAWKEIMAFRKKDNGMLMKLRGLGHDVSTGVRKKGAKFYPVIIVKK